MIWYEHIEANHPMNIVEMLNDLEHKIYINKDITVINIVYDTDLGKYIAFYKVRSLG